MLLVVAGLLSVVGVAFTGRSLFWLILNGPSPSEHAPWEFLKIGLGLAAWTLVAAAAYMGWRRDAVPATWILVSIPIVCWMLILAQRYEPV